MTDGQHSYSCTYDALNRPIYTTFNFDSQSAVFAYTYDLAGRQTSSSLSLNGHSDRVNQVTYDFLGNVTKINQTGSAVDEIFAEFDYNANGLLTAINRYEEDENDVLTAVANSLYEYNANNAVTSITHKNPDETQIVQHSYTYDETNNIVEYLNSIDGATSYDYDYLGQIIGADYANQNLTDEAYTYDENGNRITANSDTYTTGTNNELTSDGEYTYTYDAEGNRISKTNAANTERELYMWDYRNRLTTVTKQTYDTLTNEWTTVQIVEYAYDYNNVWIRKTLDTNGDGIADSKTIFVPENYQTTVQIDNNATTHHYLWTPNTQDKLLADTTPNSTSWALTDHLGTVRDVLGDTSTHLIYDAFGNLISGTNPLLFGFTGKAFDPATNLQNNINRWYDATIGRWLSTDPIGFEGNDTNLYRYVGNQSVNFTDVVGLFSVADIITSINKVGMVHSGTISYGPFPFPPYPLLSASVSVTFSSVYEVCNNGCKDLSYYSFSLTFSVTGRYGTKLPGVPKTMGKTKKQQEDNKNQMKQVRKTTGKELAFRGIRVGSSDCPDSFLDISGSVTVGVFIGAYYGVEGYVTRFIDDLHTSFFSGFEIGYNNVWGRTGAEITLTGSGTVSGIVYE